MYTPSLPYLKVTLKEKIEQNIYYLELICLDLICILAGI